MHARTQIRTQIHRVVNKTCLLSLDNTTFSASKNTPVCRNDQPYRKLFNSKDSEDVKSERALLYRTKGPFEAGLLTIQSLRHLALPLRAWAVVEFQVQDNNAAAAAVAKSVKHPGLRSLKRGATELSWICFPVVEYELGKNPSRAIIGANMEVSGRFGK